jgi:hypothetical protein
MMKNRKLFYLALILFITSMALNFPFPHEDPYGETIVSVLNIPVRSTSGLQYVGIASLILLIASLYFLTKSVKRYHGRLVFLDIIIAIFAPMFAASSFQKTFATGIYAVSYERDLSNCRFDMVDKTMLHGECELPFENYSKNDVSFTIKFYEEYYFEDDVRMISLMNNNAPYEVTLKGNERKNVKIETNIDVANIENHVESGGSTSVNIIIKSEEKMRKL